MAQRPVLSHSQDLSAHSGQVLGLSGQYEWIEFRDKANRPRGFGEPWLKLEGGHRVLLRGFKNLPQDSQNLTLYGRLFWGSIDSDNPQVQSRLGYRLDALEED